MRAQVLAATIACALTGSVALAQAKKPSPPPTQSGSSVLDDINSVFGEGTSKTAAPQASAPGTAAGSATAISRIGAAFEVAGLRIGMPAAVAQKQAMALDARFQATPDAFTLTDLPGLQMTGGVVYNDATQTANHTLILGLTLAPKSAAVWGIGRIQNFDENALPAVDSTMAALRAKYGPEVARDDSPIQHQYRLIWILDENGNRMEGSHAKVVAQACAGYGVASQNSRSDVTNGWPTFSMDCTTYSFLSARLDEWPPTMRDRAGRLKGPGMLKSLQVHTICWPLRRANYLATTMAADRARAGREKGEKAKAAGRVPVL